jgi:hypothetical protein
MTTHPGVRDLVLLVALLSFFPSEGVGADAQVARVSIVELIATPRAWDGKRVRVQGFCHAEFEETGLYLHREDSDLRNSLNGVWLEIEASQYKKCNEQFVIVEGRFDAGPDDHVGIWRGRLRDVTKMLIVPQRSEQERR